LAVDRRSTANRVPYRMANDIPLLDSRFASGSGGIDRYCATASAGPPAVIRHLMGKLIALPLRTKVNIEKADAVCEEILNPCKEEPGSHKVFPRSVAVDTAAASQKRPRQAHNLAAPPPRQAIWAVVGHSGPLGWRMRLLRGRGGCCWCRLRAAGGASTLAVFVLERRCSFTEISRRSESDVIHFSRTSDHWRLCRSRSWRRRLQLDARQRRRRYEH